MLVGILIPVYKSTSSYTSVYSSIRQTVWPLFSAYCRKLLSTLPAMLGSMPFLLPFFWLRSTSNARREVSDEVPLVSCISFIILFVTLLVADFTDFAVSHDLRLDITLVQGEVDPGKVRFCQARTYLRCA